jgi:hypothetical protein
VNLKKFRSLRRFVDLDREMQIRRLAYHAVPVARRSKYSTVAHVTVFKAASQWVRLVLSDPRVYRYSGLSPYYLGSPPELRRDPLRHPVPPQSLPLTVYASRSTFEAMPKPASWHVLLVVRDPLDLLVSWHFSMRYTHPPNPWVDRRRAMMEGLSEHDALMVTIEEFREVNDLLLPWLNEGDDPRVSMYRYEDLTGTAAYETWRRLLLSADIALPDATLKRLLDDYRQDNMRGRTRDQTRDKYGSGRPGSWPAALSADHVDRIKSMYSDLLHLYYRRFPSTIPLEQGGFDRP